MSINPKSRLSRLFEYVAWMLRSVKVRRRDRSLRLAETLPLGDKRFLAIVDCDQKQLLIGVTNHSITLLEQWSLSSRAKRHREPLSDRPSFHGVH